MKSIAIIALAVTATFASAQSHDGNRDRRDSQGRDQSYSRRDSGRDSSRDRDRRSTVVITERNGRRVIEPARGYDRYDHRDRFDRRDYRDYRTYRDYDRHVTYEHRPVVVYQSSPRVWVYPFVLSGVTYRCESERLAEIKRLERDIDRCQDDIRDARRDDRLTDRERDCAIDRLEERIDRDYDRLRDLRC